MAFQDELISYSMSEEDEKLAFLARSIVVAYSGSYKPNIIRGNMLTVPPYYRWIHTPSGFFLIVSDTADFKTCKIIAQDETIGEFIEKVFSVMTGDSSVKASQVFESEAVKHAVGKIDCT